MRSLLAIYIVYLLFIGAPVFSQTLNTSTQAQSGVTQPSVHPLMEPFFLGVRTATNPVNCLFCSVLVHAIEKYTQQHHLKVDAFILNRYCDLFEDSFQSGCKNLISTNGPKLIEILKVTTNPDQVCSQLNFCTLPQCLLYPQNYSSDVSFSHNMSMPEADQSTPQFPSPSTFIDDDGDHFSAKTDISGGYDWKGRDCDDQDDKIYPGRKVNPYPEEEIDFNCNGIQGKNRNSKKSLKETVCDGTTQLGTVVVGDSIGARYEIPLKWFDASKWKREIFTGMSSHLQGTFNVPQYSGFTGTCPEGQWPCRSFYKYLSEWNKCNTGDYINIAVNGATLNTTLVNIQNLPRDQLLDYPVIMFFELLVNDICKVMTDPEDFRAEFLSALTYLDNKLPQGSHLVVIGLFEYDFYGNMLDKIHPGGFTYADLYTFANCTGVPLCPGLLNPDKSQRDIRLQHAHVLNQVYKDVLSSQQTNSFDSIYYDFPSQHIVDEYRRQRRDLSQILDPVDGFHLSQRTQAMLADYLWKSIKKDRPQWIGKKHSNISE